MKKAFFLTIIFSCLFPGLLSASQKEKKHRLAVAQFSAMNCPDSLAGIARNAAEMRLFLTNRFEILEHQQIDKLLLEKADGQKERCTTPRCLNRVGRLLRSRYIVTGSIEKLDGWRITIKVYEVETERLVTGTFKKIAGKEELREGAEEAADIIAERLLSNWRGSDVKKYNISTSLLYALPLGYLGDICSHGFGFEVEGSVHNLFIRGFFIGALFSFIHYRGSGDTVHHSWMNALQAAGGYALSINPVDIRFLIAAGLGYNRINYYSTTDSAERASFGGFQPVIRSGFRMAVKSGKYLWFSTGAIYGHVFDPGGTISWIQFNVHAELLF